MARSWSMLDKFWAVLVALMLGGIAVLVIALWLWDPFGHREIESKLARGLTEPEIIRLLGRQPDQVFDRSSAPADYYVEGWSRKERPITNRVLIFRFGEPICYVWIDKDGRVEDYFVGGT